MKDLEVRVSFLVSQEDRTYIEIRDVQSGKIIIKVQITDIDFIKLMSRQAEVKMMAQYNDTPHIESFSEIQNTDQVPNLLGINPLPFPLSYPCYFYGLL